MYRRLPKAHIELGQMSTGLCDVAMQALGQELSIRCISIQLGKGIDDKMSEHFLKMSEH